MSAKRFSTKEAATLSIYGTSAHLDANMTNLSQTGALFTLQNLKFKPTKGDLLNITVELKELAKKHTVDAEVIWVNGSEIGVCFVHKDAVVEKMLLRGPRL